MKLTLLPVMRGPGKTLLTTIAARVKPSGAMSALEIVKSVTGPMPAYTEAANRRITEERRDWNFAMAITSREDCSKPK